MEKCIIGYFKINLCLSVMLVAGLSGYGQITLNDCAGAIEICGNGAVSSNANGFGQQEITSNACSSQEHHSLWIRIEITKSGTLGFTLTPTSAAIDIDYDFFIFGPQATCDDLGDAIRCSTTNPQAAGQTDNLTGMNDDETDTSEGPGNLGNSFVKSLDVQPGETYYIVIDRPIGQSPFDLEWTGTSTIGEFPFPEGVEAQEPQDLVECVVNGSAVFDLSQAKPQINNQAQTQISFFASLEDAVDQSNEIIGDYTSNRPMTTIFARVENLLTGCSEIVDFDLLFAEGPSVPENLNYVLCDVNNDGVGTFDLLAMQEEIFPDLSSSSFAVSFYADRVNAENGNNFLPATLTTNSSRIYARVEEIRGSECFSITEVNLQLAAPTSLSGISSAQIPLKISSQTIQIGLEGNYDFSLDTPNGPYVQNPVLKDIPPGLHTLYIRRQDLCEVLSIDILVPRYPAILSPNGDGVSDLWSVSTGDFPSGDQTVMIFDRYGKNLAEFRMNDGSWDGTYQGKEMPADDYWFMFDLPDGSHTKGHFSLLR